LLRWQNPAAIQPASAGGIQKPTRTTRLGSRSGIARTSSFLTFKLLSSSREDTSDPGDRSSVLRDRSKSGSHRGNGSSRPSVAPATRVPRRARDQPSLRPQGVHRIDARRPPGGQIAAASETAKIYPGAGRAVAASSAGVLSPTGHSPSQRRTHLPASHAVESWKAHSACALQIFPHGPRSETRTMADLCSRFTVEVN
jgi:hypothetical protein